MPAKGLLSYAVKTKQTFVEEAFLQNHEPDKEIHFGSRAEFKIGGNLKRKKMTKVDMPNKSANGNNSKHTCIYYWYAHTHTHAHIMKMNTNTESK